jgi:hypothetical protein
MATAIEVYRSHATAEEIEDILIQRLTATIGTLNEDGSIHPTHVILLYEGGRFHCETASLKARNVRARATAGFIVQGEASSGRSVMAGHGGPDRLLDGEEARRAIGDVLEELTRAGAGGSTQDVWLPDN